MVCHITIVLGFDHIHPQQKPKNRIINLSPGRSRVLVVGDIPNLLLPLHDLRHILVHCRRIPPKEIDHLCFMFIPQFGQMYVTLVNKILYLAIHLSLFSLRWV